MDIDKITGPIHSTEFTGHGKVGNNNTFAKILDRTMDTVQPEECSKEAPSPTSEVTEPACYEVSRVEGRTLRHASNVLSLIEEYAQALNDPKKTLKSIEPIVVQMQQALRGLDEQSTHNPGHQDKLARLVNEIAITASIEAFKFQRGDYIA